MVLEVLYNNSKDKSKILMEKRVDTVELIEKGVKAIMKDGSTYTGDISIGADSIHSAVRSEMWRLAENKIPGYISPQEHTAVSCDYSCIFGISNPCTGIVPGGLHSVFRTKSSYLINGGPGGRVYWFYFFKLPQTVYGSDIPKYTKEDEARILNEHADDQITPDLTFRDLVAKKISSTLTALPEHVYKKWHYDRILTIGDFTHKFNPIGGHGGNAAIESSAAFTNALVKALKTSRSGSLTTLELTGIFERLQLLREERANTLMKSSAEQQRTEAMETPLHKFIALTLLPMTDTEDVLFNFSRNLPSAEKLDMVELPVKPKLVPFKDELARAPCHLLSKVSQLSGNSLQSWCRCLQLCLVPFTKR